MEKSDDKEPKLQNIPVRTAEGRQIRDAFLRQDHRTQVDYSVEEMRVLANLILDASKAEDLVHYSELEEWAVLLRDAEKEPENG